MIAAHRCLFAAVALAILVELPAAGHVVRLTPATSPPAAAPLPPPIPQIAGNWPPYTVHQVGRSVVIESSNWCAVGFVQADGSILVQWTSDGGNTALGLYRLDGEGVLRGQWEYVEAGVSFVDGELRATNLKTENIWRRR